MTSKVDRALFGKWAAPVAGVFIVVMIVSLAWRISQDTQRSQGS